MQLPAAPDTAGSVYQQQHASLPRLFHSSAAAHKRINIREQEEEDDDRIEDELEVLLDEDEDLDFDEAEFEGEQLDDPEWVGDGGVATTRHITGDAGRYIDDDDDGVGEYDVEFDEAWEDEEEVDDLRDTEDSSSSSSSSSSSEQNRSLRGSLAESLQSS
jgi:hypothetical protein